MFEITDGIFISIDMKQESDELPGKVDELVREFNREDLTFWGSGFNADQHKKVQYLNPNVSVFFNTNQVLKALFWWSCGCLWCCDLPCDII